MSYQATFQRHEIKYLLSKEEKEQILQVMEPYMEYRCWKKGTP